jgi:hypothetical protein
MQVLACRQSLVEILLFRDHANALFESLQILYNVAASHKGTPCVRHNLAGEQTNSRGFACAVGSQQAKDFTALYTEADASECLGVFEPAAQVADVDHRTCVRGSLSMLHTLTFSRYVFADGLALRCERTVS